MPKVAARQVGRGDSNATYHRTRFEVGLLESPGPDAPLIDGYISTPIMICWSFYQLGLPEPKILSGPFMQREAIATQRVPDLDRLIDVVGMLNSTFIARFRPFGSHQLWFLATSEHERSEMLATFNEIVRPGRGRPKRIDDGRRQLPACVLSRLPPLSDVMQRRLLNANLRYYTSISQGGNSTKITPAKRDDVAHLALLRNLEDDAMISDPLAAPEAVGWLFERFDQCNRTASTDVRILKLASNVRHALLKLRNERLARHPDLAGVGHYKQLRMLPVPSGLSPVQEIVRLRRAILAVPHHGFITEIFDTLSPYTQDRLIAEIGVAARDADELVSEVELPNIVSACDRLLTSLSCRPRQNLACDTVREIKAAWRAIAGPSAKCIVYPKRSTLPTGEVAVPYGECVDLVRQISETFVLDLPIDALKG